MNTFSLTVFPKMFTGLSCKVVIVVLLSIIDASLEAGNSTQVRLVGGHSNATGLVELFVRGEWVTVYQGYFKYNDGKVVCRMLGYNDSVVTVFSNGNSLFGTTAKNIVRVDFSCDGDEMDLNQCSSQNSWSPDVHGTYHSGDAGLSCEATQLRLVDGDTNQSGRVEFFFNGAWHTICGDRFDYYDARVICNSLGFSSTGLAKAFQGSHYGQGIVDTFISRLECQGYEIDIKHCSGTWSFTSNCNHRNDAGVSCGGTQIRLVNGPTNTSGRVEIYHGGHWGTICGYPYGFDNINAKVICQMLGIHNTKPIAYSYAYYGEGYSSIMVSQLSCDGSETDILACSSDIWGAPYSHCSHYYDVGVNCDGVTRIRLVDGVSEQSGRVEVLHNGHWGTIADTNFDNHDLAVICRMLGYQFSSKSFYMTGSYYGQGFGEVVVDNLQCDGGEDDIGHCASKWWPLAQINNHDHDIGVNCNGLTPIKLVGAHEGSAIGRVEYLHDGFYGTICTRGFGRAELRVVCRMLGFENIPSSAYWRDAATYSQGIGEIIVSDLQCTGVENNLGQCGGIWPGYSSCTHQNDLYVNCQGDPEKLRLVDGPNNHSGRVEIFHDGRWATICDDNFGRPDAIVICRVLNYNHPENAVFFTASHFGSVNDTVPIVMTELNCIGRETTIGQCSPIWSKRYCSHTEDIGVDCCPSCDSAAIIG